MNRCYSLMQSLYCKVERNERNAEPHFSLKLVKAVLAVCWCVCVLPGSVFHLANLLEVSICVQLLSCEYILQNEKHYHIFFTIFACWCKSAQPSVIRALKYSCCKTSKCVYDWALHYFKHDRSFVLRMEPPRCRQSSARLFLCRG